MLRFPISLLSYENLEISKLEASSDINFNVAYK